MTSRGNQNPRSSLSSHRQVFLHDNKRRQHPKKFGVTTNMRLSGHQLCHSVLPDSAHHGPCGGSGSEASAAQSDLLRFQGESAACGKESPCKSALGRKDLEESSHGCHLLLPGSPRLPLSSIPLLGSPAVGTLD